VPGSLRAAGLFLCLELETGSTGGDAGQAALAYRMAPCGGGNQLGELKAP